MNDDHEKIDEYMLDILKELNANKPRYKSAILENIQARASGEFNGLPSKTDQDAIPYRIPPGRKVQYGIPNEEFNKLSKGAQERYLKYAAARHETVQNTEDKSEADQSPPEQEQPTNACGDQVGKNGLPLIDEKAYEAYKRCL